MQDIQSHGLTLTAANLPISETVDITASQWGKLMLNLSRALNAFPTPICTRAVRAIPLHPGATCPMIPEPAGKR